MRALKNLLLFYLLGLFPGCGGHHFRSTDYVYIVPKQIHDGIEVSTLEKEKMDTSKIVELTKLILADTFPNFHSLLIVRNNKLVYENYFAGSDYLPERGEYNYRDHTIDDLHDCRSISKSITAACIGIAVKQGLIKDIDEPIFPYFTAYSKYFDSTKRKITIRHLLTMTSGLEWDEKISYSDSKNTEIQMDSSPDPIDFILSRRMVAEPGKEWNYNGGNPQLLEEILLKATGIKLDKYAEQYLFTPLGIKKYEWMHMVKDMPAAAWGLRLRSRDFAKFGILYMNDGVWNNNQVIDTGWVKQSVSPLVERPTNQKNTKPGYGYMLWTYYINKEGILALVTEANGNGGQIIFMCKRFNLLVVLTGGNYNRRDNFHGYWGAIDSVFAALQCGPEEFSFPCLHS